MIFDAAGWIAPAATMIAAVMTASNLGARVTGWGFVVFTVGAVAWVTVAIATGQHNLLYSNAFLLVVDVIGIWRWLGRRARYDAGAGMAAERSETLSAPSLFALSTLEGRPVKTEAGETIATAVEAMAGRDSGAIGYLVVREGGVAGVGERLHAIGWHEVTLHADGLRTRLGRDQIARRRTLDPAAWPASMSEADVA